MRALQHLAQRGTLIVLSTVILYEEPRQTKHLFRLAKERHDRCAGYKSMQLFEYAGRADAHMDTIRAHYCQASQRCAVETIPWSTYREDN